MMQVRTTPGNSLAAMQGASINVSPEQMAAYRQLKAQGLTGQAGVTNALGGAVNTAVQPGATQFTGNQQGGEQRYGLSGFERAIQNALNASKGYIYQGMEQGRNDVAGYTDKAVGTLSPYTYAGANANKLQADLSGANGPEAQSAAFANFQSSPEQAYQREMGQKAILQNAAALGGLHGSNVMQELQRHGVGLAAQDYGNYFNRLNDPANRGVGAASGIASLYGNAGNALAGIATGGTQSLADMRMRAGEGIAATRYDAGTRMSDNITNATQGVAGLSESQGRQIAEIIGTDSANLATLLTQASNATGLSAQQLAQLLTNINQTASGQRAGLPTAPGVQEITGTGARWLGALGGAATGYADWKNSRGP